MTATTSIDIRGAARELRARGWGIVWLPDSKNPLAKNWTLASQEPDDYRPGYNLGLMTGPISDNGVCVDLDSAQAIELADKHLPPTGMIDGRKSKPRSHRWYRVTNVPPALTSKCEAAKVLGGGPKIKHYPKIDFLGTGAQAVVPPSRHSSGEYREWEGIGEPAVVDCQELWDAVLTLAIACGYKEPKRNAGGQQNYNADRIKRAIAYLNTMEAATEGNRGSNPTFTAARALCWGFCLDQSTALGLLLSHYNPKCTPPWPVHQLEHKVKDADETPYDKPRGYLLDAERKPSGNRTGGFGTPSANGNGKTTVVHLPHLDAEPAKINLTDRGNALRLVQSHGAELRHCWPWRKWLVWDGCRWRIDDTGSVARRAKQTIANLFAWATKKMLEIQASLETQADE